MPERVITVPNLLTLSRVPLAAAVFPASASPLALAIVIAVAGVTDLLDGRVARTLRRRAGREDEHVIGEWLDPVCDKLFVVAVLVAVALRYQPPAWQIVAIAMRELGLAPLLLVHRVTSLRRRVHLDYRAARIGKLTTAAQLAAVTAIVLAPAAAPALAIAAGATGALAVAYYANRAAAGLRHT